MSNSSCNYNLLLVSVKNRNKDQISAKLCAELRRLEPSEISSFLKLNNFAISASHVIIAIEQMCGVYKYLPKDSRKGHLDKIDEILQLHIHKLPAATALTVLRVLWKEKVEEFFSIHPATTRKLVTASLSYNQLINNDRLSEMLRFIVEYGKSSEHQELIEPIIEVLHADTHKLSVEECCDLLVILINISQSEYQFKKISAQWEAVFEKVQKELLKHIPNLNAKQLKFIIIKVHQGSTMYKRKINSLKNLHSENLIDGIIGKVIADDMGFELSVILIGTLKFFKRKSTNLLDYCASSYLKETCHNEDMIKKEALKLVALISGLGTSGYKTENWDIIKERVSKSNEIIRLDNLTLIALISDLICLDWYPVHLLERIFQDPFNYPKYIMRRLISIYQKLKSNPDYSGPMPSDAQVDSLKIWLSAISPVEKRSIFHYIKQGTRSTSCFKSKIMTRSLHWIDHVVAFREDGSPFPMENNFLAKEMVGEFEYLEDIKIPEGCQLIPVMTMPSSCFFTNTGELIRPYQMSVESLEAQGYRVAVVNLGILDKVLKGKRTYIVMDEIRSKLNPVLRIDSS
ncbi:hypothetical protein QAD02_004351 [Eretmocerus hayati]|uniref:Uncharacterized protein n=1 Tax=Eretmocerus hayati TaxID=131215 RepID=A0ACC2NPB2_9HYME|nr:hypothetical protein QAD02_004351 [Eretmocerus hayati]